MVSLNPKDVKLNLFKTKYQKMRLKSSGNNKKFINKSESKNGNIQGVSKRLLENERCDSLFHSKKTSSY